MRNFKRTLSFVSLLIIAIGMAQATPRSVQQAKKIAQQHALKMGIALQPDGLTQKAVKASKIAAAPGAQPTADSYYVFENGDDRGFTIVSGDDRLPDIVGYSLTGSYNMSRQPDAFVYYMRSYEEMAQRVAQGDDHALSTVREAEALRASSYQQPIVAPLLGDTKWNQDWPFNAYVPMFDGTNHSATGCVAKAMAQVMMYHRWPDVLKADIPAYTTSTYGLNVEGIAAGEKIDWDNMLPQYLEGQYYDENVEAVAKLMLMCGAAVKMNYGPSSGAGVSAYTMTHFFGYDPHTTMTVNRAGVTLEQWVDAIDNDLQAQRPILYSGSSSDGGHRFVLDGADGRGLYHVNWGWGGYQDGYFDISILNPAKGGTGSGMAADGYNTYNSMIIGLQKDNGIVDTDLPDFPILSVDKWSDNAHFNITTTRANAQQPFTCDVRMTFGNVSSNDVLGVSMAFGVKDAQGQLVPISPIKTSDISAPEGSIMYGTPYEHVFDYVFPVGRTVIYGIYKPQGCHQWKLCQQSVAPIVVEATATTLTIQPTPLTAILESKVLFSDMESTFDLTLTNNSDYEYCNSLYVFVNDNDTKPEEPFTSVWVTVPANGTITRSFSMPLSAGQHYLWVQTPEKQGNVDIISAQRFTIKEQGTPDFLLTNVTSNATDGEMERENAYYGSYRVELPRVNDDVLKLKYSILNRGDDYTTMFCVDVTNAMFDNNHKDVTFDQLVTFPKNVTTDVEVQVPFSELGSNSMTTEAMFANSSLILNLPESTNSYFVVDDELGRAFFTCANENWFYLTGVPSGIQTFETLTISHGLTLQSRSEALLLTATVPQQVRINTLAGQCVANVVLSAHQTQTVQLPAGIYIVGGKKVVVR